jgi:hypothetical protein
MEGGVSEKDRTEAGRLEAAGWRSWHDTARKSDATYWRNPADGRWHAQEAAVGLQEGRKEPGGDERTEAVRELEAAGWERRGEGPKAIWRRPEGGRWYAQYQALKMLRGKTLDERLDALEKPPTQGGTA